MGNIVSRLPLTHINLFLVVLDPFSKLPRHTVTALGSQEILKRKRVEDPSDLPPTKRPAAVVHETSLGLKRQRDERPLISPPTKPLVSTHVMNHSLKRERDEEHLVFPPAKRVAPAIREGQTVELLGPLRVDLHRPVDVLVSDSGMRGIKRKREEDNSSSESPPIKRLIQEERKVTGSSSVSIFVLPNELLYNIIDLLGVGDLRTCTQVSSILKIISAPCYLKALNFSPRCKTDIEFTKFRSPILSKVLDCAQCLPCLRDIGIFLSQSSPGVIPASSLTLPKREHRTCGALRLRISAAFDTVTDGDQDVIKYCAPWMVSFPDVKTLMLVPESAIHSETEIADIQNVFWLALLFFLNQYAILPFLNVTQYTAYCGTEQGLVHNSTRLTSTASRESLSFSLPQIPTKPSDDGSSSPSCLCDNGHQALTPHVHPKGLLWSTCIQAIAEPWPALPSSVSDEKAGVCNNLTLSDASPSSFGDEVRALW
ncbi:hypothetical protein HD554DRAFT_2178552 [Boletus coccyginus]|nr:hypothetical protein HD554DRAFT_2178552 [Boletus coccyginus]